MPAYKWLTGPDSGVVAVAYPLDRLPTHTLNGAVEPQDILSVFPGEFTQYLGGWGDTIAL